MEYDTTLRGNLCEVSNTPVVSDESGWSQASLPVKLGDLGVHSAGEVAPSAYLVSLCVFTALIHYPVISPHNNAYKTYILSCALKKWKNMNVTSFICSM